MKYNIKPTSQFKKDLKSAQKRGYDLDLLKEVINILADGESLPQKIVITCCQVTTQVAVNATLLPTGCLYMKFLTTNCTCILPAQERIVIYSKYKTAL